MKPRRGRVFAGDLVRINGWHLDKHGCLKGRVFGHPSAPDGSSFSTSPIVGVRYRLAVTASGRHYFLGCDGGFDQLRARFPLTVRGRVQYR